MGGYNFESDYDDSATEKCATAEKEKSYFGEMAALFNAASGGGLFADIPL